MSLSDWDSLSVNENGKSIDGTFTTSSGVKVEIYKNWIYIHDEKAWRNQRYSKPIVMEITQGSVIYQDLQLLALRGPQNGVYVVAWDTKDCAKPRGMIGCGVSVFSKDRKHRTRHVGVMKSSLSWLKKELNKKETTYSTSTLYRGNSRPIHRRHRYEDYVYYVPDVFRKLDLKKAERFNQGDVFLSRRQGDVFLSLGKHKKTMASVITKRIFRKK